MAALGVTFLSFIIYITLAEAVTPQACFAEFRRDDCGLPATPVFYYWKSGSRCEVGYWRGCLPNLNMFNSEHECVSTCIFTLSETPEKYHELFKDENVEEDLYVDGTKLDESHEGEPRKADSEEFPPSTVSVDSTNSTDPTNSSDSINSTDPTASTDPTTSIDPTASTDPTTSSDPTASTDPTTSTNSTASTETTDTATTTTTTITTTTT